MFFERRSTKRFAPEQRLTNYARRKVKFIFKSKQLRSHNRLLNKPQIRHLNRKRGHHSHTQVRPHSWNRKSVFLFIIFFDKWVWEKKESVLTASHVTQFHSFFQFAGDNYCSKAGGRKRETRPLEPDTYDLPSNLSFWAPSFSRFETRLRSPCWFLQQWANNDGGRGKRWPFTSLSFRLH